MTEYRVSVNGIIVDAHYSEKTIDTVFLPLLERLSLLRMRKGKRILVMFAAPPGCGKTTLVSFLEKLWRERGFPGRVCAIGMDGFHRKQEYLKTHTIRRDGEDIPMVRIKGAPVTFDLDRLAGQIERAARGEVCRWPVYDRLLHDPVDDAVWVDGDVILLEGNYLLLDEDGWRGLSSFADYSVSISADESFLRSRLIRRRVLTGVDEESAERFVDFSDMHNVRLCLSRTRRADLNLRIDEKGDYHAVES